jgi:hypothetical protein
MTTRCGGRSGCRTRMKGPRCVPGRRRGWRRGRGPGRRRSRRSASRHGSRSLPGGTREGMRQRTGARQADAQGGTRHRLVRRGGMQTSPAADSEAQGGSFPTGQQGMKQCMEPCMKHGASPAGPTGKAAAQCANRRRCCTGPGVCSTAYRSPFGVCSAGTLDGDTEAVPPAATPRGHAWGVGR